jgi:hypothetical protein
VTSQPTIDLLRHLAGKPGHDEVKADFRQLLIEEFGAELSALDFERRVPVVRGRLDALIGRTVFEAKWDLAKELGTSSARCQTISLIARGKKARRRPMLSMRSGQ